MQLKQIKLAGFKSFVEPTTVPITSQLVAIVGPNGCGKSNIIDAVRWVMGESSNKILRSESMTDVIFKGSSARKPVGQAFVELIFDNRLGQLTGPYAAYQEIAIKRLITRTGESHYALNGSCCRKKDITDIFLGTGSGARGYSIIGQDMISNLIEARPEDLKAYLEEAAGVSKYKERRRETLLHINHTQENLTRITDILEELTQQFVRLERQAKAAEHYKTLKQEERLCKINLLALKWKNLSTAQADSSQKLRQHALAQEQMRSQVTAYLKTSVLLKEQLHQSQENTQQTQVKLFELNTDIARLEENIQQQRTEKQRLNKEKQLTLSELQKTTANLEEIQQLLTDKEASLFILQKKRSENQSQLTYHQQLLNESEQKKLQADQRWIEAQTATHELQREHEKIEISLHHLQQRYQEAQLRHEKNQQEQDKLAQQNLQNELSNFITQHHQYLEQHQLAAEKHQNITQEITEYRKQLASIEQQIHQAHDQVQTLTLEHAKLLALQNTSLRHSSKKLANLSPWDNHPRLAEIISINNQWITACEKLLDGALHAIMLDSFDQLLPKLLHLKGQTLLFITPSHIPYTKASYPRLSDQISGKIPRLPNLLEHTFTAPTIEEALTWLPTLNDHESIVTADGFWLGPGWIKIEGTTDRNNDGLLTRQQTLIKLENHLSKATNLLKNLQKNREQMHGTLIQTERESDALKQQLLRSQEALNNHTAQINHKKHLIEQTIIRSHELTIENDTLKCQLKALNLEKITAEEILQHTQKTTKQQRQTLEQCAKIKISKEKTYNTYRDHIDKARHALHLTEIEYNKEKLNVQQLHDRLSHEQQLMTRLQTQTNALEVQYHSLTNPNLLHERSLKNKLQQHQKTNDLLNKQRLQENNLQQELKNNNELRQKAEQKLLTLQEHIQQEQLQEKTLLIRSEHLLESMTQLETNIKALKNALPTHLTQPALEEKLGSLDEKIKRLGIINLLAIEEYQSVLARKNALNEQYQDLVSAIETLQTAISKMDKETHLRLKDTFNQINASFQLLFPRLFKGGSARLELTCDNLLQAGILVMAQPPGKHQGSIHLLSGGEKALTAMALVFAMFQQNPSPFCMLDEVDAPLDDTNVKLFCDLVNEMSRFVQFLFITHNKITMELADHLIGVTMRESGVSRLVAVDVKEALSIIT